MPIYEFYCPDNNKLYSFFARSQALRTAVPRCPDGEGLRMEKRLSRFSVTKGGGEGEGVGEGEDILAGMDESKMEALMVEMEREMSGMDEENPDPRQLGRFMRKMADAMGGRVPEAMQEMIVRLEKGEDPDALESEYGDALEDDEVLEAFKKVRRLRADSPVRDPKLYEMADYVE